MEEVKTIDIEMLDENQLNTIKVQKEFFVNIFGNEVEDVYKSVLTNHIEGNYNRLKGSNLTNDILMVVPDLCYALTPAYKPYSDKIVEWQLLKKMYTLWDLSYSFNPFKFGVMFNFLNWEQFFEYDWETETSLKENPLIKDSSPDGYHPAAKAQFFKQILGTIHRRDPRLHCLARALYVENTKEFGQAVKEFIELKPNKFKIYVHDKRVFGNEILPITSVETSEIAENFVTKLSETAERMMSKKTYFYGT